jgi:hypothetical protein
MRATDKPSERQVCLMGAELGESLTLGSARGRWCNSAGSLTRCTAHAIGKATFGLDCVRKSHACGAR